MLEHWANFYAMTGSSAAALTGLMFVTITLVAGERMRRNPDGISTFSTPTVAHFGAVLFVSYELYLLPFLAYAAILAAAIFMLRAPATALFLVAAAVMLLIFIGIHNAWDIVTYIAAGAGDEPPDT